MASLNITTNTTSTTNTTTNDTLIKLEQKTDDKLLLEMHSLETHDLEFQHIAPRLQKISKSPQFQGHLKLLQHF